MAIDEESLFQTLKQGLEARISDGHGHLLKNFVEGSAVESAPEADDILHPICQMLDEALQQAAPNIFNEFPRPIVMLAMTVLQHTYHEFGHYVFELGRQYEIDNALTPEHVKGISVDDLGKEP